MRTQVKRPRFIVPFLPFSKMRIGYWIDHSVTVYKRNVSNKWPELPFP
jgi:hypothetical protein